MKNLPINTTVQEVTFGYKKNDVNISTLPERTKWKKLSELVKVIFIAVFVNLPTNTLLCHNRWGNIVGELNEYSSDNENKNLWSNLTEGVYYYLVKSECEEEFSGFVHLIK